MKFTNEYNQDEKKFYALSMFPYPSGKLRIFNAQIQALKLCFIIFRDLVDFLKIWVMSGCTQSAIALHGFIE